jgi:hypothetical protein
METNQGETVDKNEIYEQLQWFIGMAMTIEYKIKSSEELTLDDYKDLDKKIAMLRKALKNARIEQFGS